MWIKPNKDVIGWIIAAIAIIIAIVAVSPSGWKENVTHWYSFISAYRWIFLIVILTPLIVNFLLKRKMVLCLISSNKYLDEFHKLLKSGNYPIVKIFGYTGEVVNNDLITYLDRYSIGVEIRYLQRDWIVEEQDETAHNNIIATSSIRPWNKANAIKNMAFENWNFPLTRDIRYYKHQPIIKGAIFCDKNQQPIIAFINFQKWIPVPANGGSVFKSVPSDMIKINSKENSNFSELVERIDSQFEYEWRYGSTKEKINTQNKRDNKNKK
jgi:hypothetical protein